MSDESTPAVPAEDAPPDEPRELDFEVADDGSIATKVGTVGWPEGAENEEGTGPGSDEPDTAE